MKTQTKPQRVSSEQAKQALKNIFGWQMASDEKMIWREFVLQDFLAAIDLVNRIAQIAQSMDHHPDLHLSYNKLRVELSTHDAGGLSNKDFEEAAKINTVPARFKQ